MKKIEGNLSLLPVISISISAMLGSGLFVLPGIAFLKTGSSVWVAYLLAAVAVLPAALSKSELASAMPTSGGTYVYLERTFGPLVGTVAGLGLWLSLLFKSALALVGFGSYLEVLADVNLYQTSMGLLVAIIFLNIIGTGKVSKALTFIVGFTLFILVFLEFASINYIQHDKATELFPFGMTGLFEATALVFVSYAGVTKVAAIAEEIKDPAKNLPRGILLSLLIVTILYCSVNFILSMTFSADQLSNNLKPIYDLGAMVGGKWGGIIVAVTAILCMTSMANAGLLASSRFPFAMSRDHLFPSIFGKINSRFLTPTTSIIASGVIIGLAISFLNIEVIAKLASAFILIIYVSESIAVIVLRETRVQWYMPKYKSLFYPWAQIFGIVSGLALLSSLGISVIAKCAALIVIPGVLFYLVYGRRYTTRKGVLGFRLPRRDLVEEQIKDENEPEPVTSLDLTEDAMVIVSLFGKERSPEMLIEMGAALADGNRLEVAHLTEVPEQTDLRDFADEPMGLNSLRRRVIAMAMQHKIPVTFDPIVSHDLLKSIYTMSTRLHSRWLMVEFGGRTRGAFTMHNPIGWLQDHLDCHLGIFRDAGVRYIRKIMVIMKDHHNDQMIIDTADHLCRVHKAEMTLVGFIGGQAQPEEVQDKIDVIEASRQDYIGGINSAREVALGKSDYTGSHISVKVIQGVELISSFVKASAEYDLMVFGVDIYRGRSWDKKIFGGVDDRLTEKAHCSVLKIRPFEQIV